MASPKRHQQQRGDLPLRACYRIGEVARWAGVSPHVIRFWCVEFAHWVHPATSAKGQRVFSRNGALVIGVIRELLYTELYTIEGAKRQLRLARERELGKEAG